MGYTSPEQQAIDNIRDNLSGKLDDITNDLESIQNDLNSMSRGGYTTEYLNFIDESKITLVKLQTKIRKIKSGL